MAVRERRFKDENNADDLTLRSVCVMHIEHWHVHVPWCLLQKSCAPFSVELLQLRMIEKINCC